MLMVVKVRERQGPEGSTGQGSHHVQQVLNAAQNSYYFTINLFDRLNKAEVK